MRLPDCRSRGCVSASAGCFFRIAREHLFLLFSRQYKFPASCFSLVYNAGFKLYENCETLCADMCIPEIFRGLKSQTNAHYRKLLILKVFFLSSSTSIALGSPSVELFLELGRNLYLLKSEGCWKVDDDISYPGQIGVTANMRRNIYRVWVKRPIDTRWAFVSMDRGRWILLGTRLRVMVFLMAEQKRNAIIPGMPRNTREYNV